MAVLGTFVSSETLFLGAVWWFGAGRLGGLGRRRGLVGVMRIYCAYVGSLYDYYTVLWVIRCSS